MWNPERVKDNKDITYGRWVEPAIDGLEDWLVLWAFSEGDYQGSCAFIAKDPMADSWAMVDWDWGSCPGCDGYEGMGDQELYEVFRNQREVYGRAALEAWLHQYEDTNHEYLANEFLRNQQSWEEPRLSRVNAIRYSLDLPAWMP